MLVQPEGLRVWSAHAREPATHTGRNPAARPLPRTHRYIPFHVRCSGRVGGRGWAVCDKTEGSFLLRPRIMKDSAESRIDCLRLGSTFPSSGFELPVLNGLECFVDRVA